MTYVQGFLIPVPKDKREDYRKMAEAGWPAFKRLGAISTMEGFAHDVPRGEHTDFYRAVQAEEGEEVVFSWIVWPDEDTYKKAFEAMMDEPEFQNMDMPFDGKRMMWGGFEPIFEGR